jgi:hypothetical protein
LGGDRTSSRKLLIERLPPYLLAEMREHAAEIAWPLAMIPVVIEACRTVGLVSLGGSLQVHEAQGVWESPNIGVTVFAHELADHPVEQAAVVALRKVLDLRGDDLLGEVATGRPKGLEGIGSSDLLFSWVVRKA